MTAALRIVDRRGLGALTMRAVGSALGYEAMSLYKHVANKQQLLDLVVDRVTAELEPPDPGTPWPDRLRHIAAEWRRLALAHPHVFALLATGPPPSPPSLMPLIDGTLGALREAIDDDERATTYFWTFLAFTTGALLAECAATIGRSSPPISVPAAVDPEGFPHLAALGTALAAVDFASEYERGLELFIASARSARPS